MRYKERYQDSIEQQKMKALSQVVMKLSRLQANFYLRDLLTLKLG